MKKDILTRRDFLKVAGVTSAGLALSACGVDLTTLPDATATLSLTPSPTATNTPPSTATPTPTPLFLERKQDPLKTGRLVMPDTLGLAAHFLGNQVDPGEIYAFLDGGFHFVRLDLDWTAIEKRKGEYHFEEYVSYISRFEYSGIRTMLIVDHHNPLYSASSALVSGNTQQAFVNFLVAATKALNGKAIVWEVYNEPDNDEFWLNPNPKDYNQLVRLVIDTLRKENPESVIVAPSIYNIQDTFSLQFIEELGENKTIHELDAITVHPYRYSRPENSLQDFLRVRRLVDGYSPDKVIPVLWGECGYNAKDIGVDAQAMLAIRQYLFSLTQDSPYTNWYCWRDYYYSTERGTLFGMVGPSVNLKPAYKATQALAETLNGFEYFRQLPAKLPSDYILLFYKNGQYALAAWTTGETHDIEILSISSLLEIRGMFGEKLTELESSFPQITISKSPIYVKFNAFDNSLQHISWKPRWNVQSVNLKNPQIMLQFFNADLQSIPLTLKIRGDGIQAISLTLEILTGETNYPISINLSSQSEQPSKATIEVIQDGRPVESGIIWLSPFSPEE
jgi:hypothetical protein